jgi:hypothetical protein
MLYDEHVFKGIMLNRSLLTTTFLDPNTLTNTHHLGAITVDESYRLIKAMILDVEYYHDIILFSHISSIHSVLTKPTHNRTMKNV